MLLWFAGGGFSGFSCSAASARHSHAGAAEGRAIGDKGTNRRTCCLRQALFQLFPSHVRFAQVNIPKRRGAGSGHEKAQDRFMQQIVQAIETHVDFDKVKALLLASPGFLREEVHA